MYIFGRFEFQKVALLCILSLKLLEGLKCLYFKSNVAFYIIFFFSTDKVLEAT